MTEPEQQPGRWAFPKLSIVPLLATALSISLIFSAYLFFRLSNQAQGASPAVEPVPAASAPTNAPTASAADMQALMAQLAGTQSRLQDLANQLDQKGQSLGYSSTGPAGQGAVVYEDIPALWAEIDQLYQIMQPLMAQVEAASASPSSRSASEMIALRTRVNTIHQRLAHLLARVEAANARSGAPVPPSSWNNPAPWGTAAGTPNDAAAASSDAVMLQQLYQNMTEMNHLLQQLQRQGSGP